tara:strand:- start:1650 stop:2678 length:1029 start_codon:yes stop_codon:yes gene_type:complete
MPKISDSRTLLEVTNLHVEFNTENGKVRAVDGINFTLNEGEILGIVGESGCGKSTTAHSILNLIAPEDGKITNGEIIFNSQNLLQLSQKEIRKIRGNGISMIFQEPNTSLNPVISIGQQISETIELHLNLTKSQARNHAIKMLEQVGIPDAKSSMNLYPHQLSGGMQQRVMIAIAMSCSPQLLIADEPTTALDVTIQAQILDLMQDLVTNFHTSLILITHDLGVIARYTHKVAVMYAGKIIEIGSTEDVFLKSIHPYTLGLINSIPRLDTTQKELLTPIDGYPPDLIEISKGCRFSNRCKFAYEKCYTDEPLMKKKVDSDGFHQASCWRSEELEILSSVSKK